MSTLNIPDLTVARIRAHLNGLEAIDDALLSALETDPRRGVKSLALRERKRRKAEAAEHARLEKMLNLERKLRARGIGPIAGVYEAGRGPLAGPVVAAAVILPEDLLISGLNDSKALSADRRETLFDRIGETALAVSVGRADSGEIDRLNILQATHLAMRRALETLSLLPERVLVDGNSLPNGPYPEIAVVDGDATSLSIAAASIVAKVTRDRLMAEYDRQFPGYGFSRHKGYGSADHLRALAERGPCPIHRQTFSGVSRLHPGRSEDFRIFIEGIGKAASPAQLEAIGSSIASASVDLPPAEVDALREHYRKRRAALTRTGPRGETLATQELVRKGYRILHRSYRAAGGEIDLIARRGNILAFIEVKTATTPRFGPPETWVTREKQRQIVRVAGAYLQRHPAPALSPRFDVVAVHLSEDRPAIRHIEAAFRTDDTP